MKDVFADLEVVEEGTSRALDELLEALRFNDQGLIPAVAQAADSKRVLMLAWMNLASLRETLATGQVCYYSRSRRALWRKGETSGHTQRLVSLRVDCDGDALLLEIEQTGPACHTNRQSCFYLKVEGRSVRVSLDD